VPPGNPGWSGAVGQARGLAAQSKTAHGQAPEVKADSRYVRFVIAKHSPEQVLETGLPMEAREKSRCNRNVTARHSTFSGPVC
jgi:hypothetical protein